MAILTTSMQIVFITVSALCTAPGLAAPSSRESYGPSGRTGHDASPSEVTYPSLVDNRGQHISYKVHLTPSLSSSAASLTQHAQPNSAGRTYFKLEAFGKHYLLNVSTSTHFLHNSADGKVPVVEYISADGSSETKAFNRSRPCFHTGHVQLLPGGDSREEREVVGEEEEGLVDGWVAMSSCSGLHGILATSEGYLLIEPSAVPVMEEEEEEKEMKKQSHLVSRHKPLLHSEDTCSTTHLASPEEDYPSSDALRRRRRKRSYGVDEYFVETTVVADESMLGVHRKEDLEAYLYTLMNIVTHLYREPTIGHPINIVLVRTIILEDDPASLGTSNAVALLNSFCSWQNSINGRNSRPHHDVAVMVTRKEICEGAAGNNCGTLGMADIASICNSARSCNVNKDIGLSTAFTIAHEMGHNLGVRHDGDPQSLDCDADVKYIMAPSFAQSMNPHMWSNCSRKQLNNFLRSSDSECLENRPSNGGVALEDRNTSSLLLPGMEYTPTEQCQLQYGNDSTHCPEMQNGCQYLWCRSGGATKCSHGNNPPAPGTECLLSWGEMGVCFQGLCMELSLVSEPRDGGWGLWGPWSNCSVTCGTGVQYSERECDSPIPANGGRYCSGQKRRYRTCNSQSCLEDVDFRKKFCMDNPPNDRYSSWEAVSLERLLHLKEDMCISHCIPTGTSLLHKTEIELPDGAPCLTENSRGICISGSCRPIGCDHQLNAESQRDVCGVWCGNGTSCVSVTGTFSRVDHPGHYRYYPAVTIPRGSTRITIEEVTASRHNFIAILGSSSGDILNGNYNVLPSGLSLKFLAGATWTYERPLHATEFLRTDGPIKENVTVYLLANSTYNGIRYTFSVSKDLVGEISNAVYYWNMSDWSECSVECGRGEQEREISCTKLLPNGETESVDISSCDPTSRPDTRRPCNPGVCLYEWEAGEWSVCDSVCGEGRQSRTVICKWQKRNGTSEEVDDNFCDSYSEPNHFQSCQVESCRYEWHEEEWGKCDSHCGEGWKKREVVCLWMNLWLSNGGELQSATVSDSHCGDDKPDDSVECDMESCENFQWITTDWSECDAPCNGDGFQYRTITCQHRNGTDLASPFCTWQYFPEVSQSCRRVCPTTPPSSPTTDSLNSCSNLDSDYFCNQVVKFSLCHIYRKDCCASCAGR